ncbi:MAG: beta-ribofuranosylaminobenzene 5'-phosphate synthase family protein [Halobacteriales archaeon]
MPRVTTGARLHFGFQNLSLAHQRLYGGLGVGIEEPRVTVEATPSDGLEVDDDLARRYAKESIDRLGVPGASVDVHRRLPRHVGLGSGTQLALATYVAIASAHDREPDPRSAAPALGRGGRSGVGVATFEAGGFVVDGGHPTDRFTTAPPAAGEWTVSPVLARHRVPDAWRFVVVVPNAARGQSGAEEDRSIRRVVEEADAGVADEISAVTIRRLLPAVATDDVDAFGTALEQIGRLNGTWYADEQGGIFRPPAGKLVSALSASPAIEGAGQSSWGPAVYGLTDRDRVERARADAEAALEEVDVDGTVTVSPVDNDGAVVRR